MITLLITTDYSNPYVGINEVTYTSTLSPNPPHISVDQDDIEYYWYINDELKGTDSTLSYTYNTSGYYEVKSVCSWIEDSSANIISYVPLLDENGDLYRVILTTDSIILNAGDNVFLNTEDALSGNRIISYVSSNQTEFWVDFVPALTGSWTPTTYASDETILYSGTANGKRRISLSAYEYYNVKELYNEDITITTLSSTNIVGSLNKFTTNFYIKSLSSIDVVLYPNGATSRPLSELKSALEAPHWYFTDIDGNITNTLTLTGNKVYFNLSGDITSSYENDFEEPPVENYFWGISGTSDFYYYDEIPANIVITATVDSKNFTNPYEKEIYLDSRSYANSLINDTFVYTLSSVSPNKILITKDGYNPIDNIQWINQKIPFVGIISDSSGNNVLRNHPTVASSLTSVVLSSIDSLSSTEVDFVLYDENSGIGGYVKGYIIPTESSNNTKILAYSDYLGITGESNAFSVYDPNDYDYRKINENYDMGAKIKDYSLQEKFYNYDLLWQIVGSVWGDGNYNPSESVGKTVYERISNFVINNGDINTANIKSLASDYALWGEVFDVNQYDFPERIKRLVELFSINQKQLWGYKNNLRRTFNYIDEESNIQDNLGDFINTDTVVFSADDYIVIHSVRENKYELQQLPKLYTSLSSSNSFTSIPSGVEMSNYNFTTYKTFNPHGLYKDSNGNFVSNYNFYTYNNTEGDFIDNVIDWNNTKTTISSNLSSSEYWLGDNGIIEKVLNYNLKRGLDF